MIQGLVMGIDSDTTPKKIFGISFRAVLEIIFFYTAVILAAHLFGDHQRWISVCPHPFWLGVLYAAMAYGSAEGITAAVLATVFLYAGNIPLQPPDQSPTDYHMSLFTPFFLWIAIGGLLGEAKARLQDKINILTEERENFLKQLEHFSQEQLQIKQLNTRKEVIQEQQRNAMCQVFRALRELCLLKPGQMISQLDGLVVAALEPEKFSVFACGPSGLEAATCFGWKDEDVYLRRFMPSHPLYKQVVTTMRIIFRDSPLDKNLLLSEGVLAGPLIDVHTNQVFGMLKIESFKDSAPSSELLEQFKLICDLISALYSQARQLQTEEKAQIYSAKKLDGSLLSYALYRLQSSFLIHFCRNLSIPLTCLTLNLLDNHSDEFQVLQRLRQLQPIVRDLFPSYAQLFAGAHKGEYYLLLPAVSLVQAQELEGQIKLKLEALSGPHTIQTQSRALL